MPSEPVVGRSLPTMPALIATSPPWQMIPMGFPASLTARTSAVIAS
jgi:hypothetical protein